MKFRNVLLAVAAVAVLGLAACNQTSSPKVAVIDPAEVFQTCAAGVEGGEYLRAQGENMQAELTSLQESLQKDGGEEAASDFQARLQEMRTQMGEEQNRIAGILNEAFTKAMDDYRAQNNVSVLLNKENVLSYNEADDATQAIIKLMDAADIDLQLNAAEETAPEAAAEAEGKTAE